MTSVKIPKNKHLELVTTSQETGDSSGRIFASMLIPTNKDPIRVSPKEPILLDAPETVQNRGAEVKEPDSRATQHSMLGEYHLRPPLQDCTNDNTHQIEKNKVGCSVAGKGQ